MLSCHMWQVVRILHLIHPLWQKGIDKTSFHSKFLLESIIRILFFRCYTPSENLDAVITIAIKAEFHTNSLDLGGGGKDLNERERARLSELYIASRSLVEPVELEKEVDLKLHVLFLKCNFSPDNFLVSGISWAQQSNQCDKHDRHCDQTDYQVNQWKFDISSMDSQELLFLQNG